MQHLLLLHGAIGAKEQLTAVADELKDEFTVHLMNFNGHGDTPYRAFSIKDFADDVLAYLASNNIDKVTVFGYSMGGYVGMYLAKNHAEKMERIITLASKFKWDEAIALKEIKMLDGDVIETKVPAFAQALEQRHTASNWKELLANTAAMLTAIGKENPLRLDDYSSIGIPVLIMLGDRDKMVTLEETVEVYKQLPKGQLLVLPGTGHPIEGVDVKRLDFEIRRFIGF